MEDEATIVLLREIGVDYAQGYFIHRPEELKCVPGEACRLYGLPSVGPEAIGEVGESG